MKPAGFSHVHISQSSGELSFSVSVLLRQNAMEMRVCECVCVHNVCLCVKERGKQSAGKFCRLSSWSREK